MSFIRLLALSYLAWAAVFVVAVVLVAHLPLPGNAGGGTSAPAARTSAVAPPPAGKPDVRKVARLELAPVPPIPTPTTTEDVKQPELPAAQGPELKSSPSQQLPPVAVAAKPGPRAVARLDLAPAPVPVPRPHADVPPPTPHVVNQPQHKPSLRQERVAAQPGLPRAAARTRGPTHLASAEPAFHIPEPRRSVIAAPLLRPREPTPVNRHPVPAKAAFRIPDPPPSSLANLPAHLQPTASRSRKQAAAEPAFHIPDPPPLEAPRL